MVQEIGRAASQARTIAQSFAQKAYRQIQKTDKDGDGKVSREEFEGREQAFDLLDINGDDTITAADFKQAFTPESTDDGAVGQLEKLLQRFVEARDEDSDGYLSLEEFGGDEEEFIRLDTDEDGRLSARELAEDLAPATEFTAAQIQKLLAGFDRQDDGSSDAAARIEERVRKQFQQLVAVRDTDGNGRLSAEELGEAGDLLEVMDTDENGELDAEEMTRFFLDAVGGESSGVRWADFRALLKLLAQPEESDSSPGAHFDTRA